MRTGMPGRFASLLAAVFVLSATAPATAETRAWPISAVGCKCRHW